MKVSTIAATIDAACAGIASAATVSGNFMLKTQVYAGNELFNNQYLITYHTGAGTNAPTFTNTTDGGSIGYLNGTTLNFHIGSYYGVLAFDGPEDTYSGWGSMTINEAGASGVSTTSPTTSGFYIGSAGYFTHAKTNTGSTFNGWRVCNWVHGVPELFFDTAYTENSDLPTSCARVYLVPEYITG